MSIEFSQPDDAERPALIFVPFKQFAAVGMPNYSRMHVYRMVKAGTFPAPYQLSPGRIGWKLSELRAWLDSRPTVTRKKSAA